MKLIFVRHGETDANVKQVLQRETGKLTPKGILQARNVGKELKKKYKIDMVFCSPYQRCVDTLEVILNECPIDGEISMSNLIIERDVGEYEGAEIYMVNWDELNEESKLNKKMGVESILSLKKRTDLFLEDLKMEDNDSTVLILSHADTIKMMINKLTGRLFDEIEVDNATVYEFDYDIDLDKFLE
jgi:broad specificity phosphatase PhoE